MVPFARSILAITLLVSGVAHAAVDLSGRRVDPLGGSGAKAVVLFFAATDCPVSNRYIPEIERLQTEFAAEGVKFWFVYPNPADVASVVKEHDAQFAITGNTALDRQQVLVRRAHATTTPEVAIFVADSATAEGSSFREVYHGRIDDRYLSFGHERPKAMHHDLDVAIHDVLDHRPVAQPGGGPVGCAIMPLQQ